MESALEQSLIEKFAVPDPLEEYDRNRLYVYSEKVIAVEYTGIENIMLYMCSHASNGTSTRLISSN